MARKIYFERTIYKAKRGKIYDPENRKYNCYRPAYAVTTPPTYIVDCWVCDESGNIHPGYNISPVPVQTSNLGEVVGEVEEV